MSTSDEMIPVFLSEHVNVLVLLQLILMKVIIGLIMGLAIDMIVRKSMTTVVVRQAYSSQH